MVHLQSGVGFDTSIFPLLRVTEEGSEPLSDGCSHRESVCGDEWEERKRERGRRMPVGGEHKHTEKKIKVCCFIGKKWKNGRLGWRTAEPGMCVFHMTFVVRVQHETVHIHISYNISYIHMTTVPSMLWHRTMHACGAPLRHVIYMSSLSWFFQVLGCLKCVTPTNTPVPIPVLPVGAGTSRHQSHILSSCHVRMHAAVMCHTVASGEAAVTHASHARLSTSLSLPCLVDLT